MGDVAGIKGRTDRDHAFDPRHVRRGFQHGSAAKRVADDQRRGHARIVQRLGRCMQIIDVGGKAGVCKIPLGCAKPGEIKAQHGNAHRRKPRGDPFGGADIFGAGKAMGKDGRGQLRTCGAFKATCKCVA